VVRISPDVGKNRLVIELVGQVGPEHFPQAEAQLKQALPRLRAPFDVLSDVRRLDGIHPDAMPLAQSIGEAIRAAGVRRVVRVVGKSANGAVHMERVARLLGHAARLAFSLEEAERVLGR
jgi:hypothetical protein